MPLFFCVPLCLSISTELTRLHAGDRIERRQKMSVQKYELRIEE